VHRLGEAAFTSEGRDKIDNDTGCKTMESVLVVCGTCPTIGGGECGSTDRTGNMRGNQPSNPYG